MAEITAPGQNAAQTKQRKWRLALLLLFCVPIFALGKSPDRSSKPEWISWDSPQQSTLPVSAIESIPQPLAVLLPNNHGATHLTIIKQNATIDSVALTDLSRHKGHTGTLYLLPALPADSRVLTLDSANTEALGLPLIGNFTALQVLQQQRDIWFWQVPNWVTWLSVVAALGLALTCWRATMRQWLQGDARLGLNVAVGLLIVVIVGDTLFRVAGFSWLEYPGMPLPLISLALLGLTLAGLYFLVSLHTNTQLTLKELNVSLDQRVQQASAELQQRYAQFTADALDAAGMRERKAIYQSIHEDLSDKLLQLIYSSNTPQSADLARSALSELRDTRNLYPDQVQLLGDLLADARVEIETRCDQAGIQLVWDFPEHLYNGHLTARQSSALTRTLREAITNMLKHAQAKEVKICFWASDSGELMYTVSDDGLGMSTTHRPGRGLVNMQNRIRELGGELHLTANVPCGTELTFRLPLTKGSANTAVETRVSNE